MDETSDKRTSIPGADSAVDSQSYAVTPKCDDYVVGAGDPRTTSAYKGTDFVRRHAPYLFIAVTTVILLWPLCIGRSLYWGDLMLYFEPMQGFARHELMAGRWPLWNPYILCGQPFIGNPQMCVFYPSTLLLVSLPVWAAMNVSAVIHMFLCGVGMYVFLRRWTVNTMPAWAGAIVYMGSAFLLGRLQFPPMVQTAVYFPLLFAMLDRNVDSPSPGTRLGLAVTVALTILAGHSQVAYLAFTSGTVYVLSRLVRRRNLPASTRGGISPFSTAAETGLAARIAGSSSTQARSMAAASVFGLLLSSIYVLPAIQVLHESPREQMSVGQANRFFADVPHLLSIVFPRFSGHPATRDFWARGNAWEPAAFVGWVPLLLAGYAVVRCRKENLVRFWLIAGLFGGWLSLGSAGGLYWLAFYVVPGLSSFHDPARFLIWTTMSLSVLTAVGFDALKVRRHWAGRVPEIIISASIVGPIVWFSADWLPTTAADNLTLQPAVLADVRVRLGQDRITQASDTLYWKRTISDGYNDYGRDDRRALQRTFNMLLSNLQMTSSLDSASGYEPVPVGSHAAIEGLSTLAQQRREPNYPRLLGLMDVREALVANGSGAPMSGLRRVTTRHNGDTVAILHNRSAVSRAWLTRSVFRVDGRTRLAAAIAAPNFDPTRYTIVSGIPPAVELRLRPAGESPPSSTPSAVTWRQVTPERVQLIAEAGATPALLVYSGTAVPGWKAMVDGRRTDAYCADGTLLGVVIPAGRHRVALTYAPDMFRFGAYLSLAAIAAVIAMGACRLTRRGAMTARKHG